MKLLIVSFLCLNFAFLNAQELMDLRSNFSKAVTQKEVCEEMINLLENDSSSSVNLAYLGAFQTIWAKHVGNPFSKLKTFKRGKKNIEQAVKNDPNNIEIRYLRYAVQKNAPGFLNYSKNLKEDKIFLEKNLDKIQSEELKKQVKMILE